MKKLNGYEVYDFLMENLTGAAATQNKSSEQEAEDLVLPKDYIELALIAVMQKHNKRDFSADWNYKIKRVYNEEFWFYFDTLVIEDEGYEYGFDRKYVVHVEWRPIAVDGVTVEEETTWESFKDEEITDKQREDIYRFVCEKLEGWYVSPKMMCFRYSDE